MFKRFFWSLSIFIGLCAAVTYGNYTATQGAGTTFGSIVVSTVHYAQMMLCDLTTPSQCAAVSASGAVKVDNSAVTQPISAASNIPVSQATAASLNATVVGTGTFATQASQSGTWNITNVSGTVSLPTGAATSALQPTNATQGSTTSGQTGHLIQCAVTTAAPTYTTAQTDPLSCDTSGNVRTLTTLTTGAATIGSLVANQSINAAQINGVTPLMGNGVTGTGSQRVTIASDNSAFTVNANASQSGTWNVNNISGTVSLPTGAATSANQTGGSQKSQIVDSSGNVIASTSNALNTNVINANPNGSATSANSSPVVLASDQSVGDPCAFQAKSTFTTSTASGTTALVTGVSAKKIYICSVSIISPAAVSASLSEGSSSTCGTSNQAAVIGVATNGTAANGIPLTTGVPFNLGNGEGTVAKTATNANYLCLFQSATQQIVVALSYIQQ